MARKIKFLRTPFTSPLEMVSPEPCNQDTDSQPPFTRQYGDPHLVAARKAFVQSRDLIMAPPPKPAMPAPTQSATVAFTQQTIYAQLLEQHQGEILRLNEKLAAEKRKTAELEAALLVASQSVASPVAKRKKLGGKLSKA